jgi:hypothetical protein
MRFEKVWEDKDILKAIQYYREGTGDKYGPPSLPILSNIVGDLAGMSQGPAKSGLSVRLRDLLDRGLLNGVRDEGGYGVVTSTLYLTKAGKELLENGD